MRKTRTLSLLLSITLLVAALSPSQATNKAETTNLPSLVSLDYCADQYVLALADRTQIKALSKRANEPYSFYRERAKGLPTFYSTISEVISLQPEIAVQSHSAAARMAEMAKRANVKIVKTRFGSDPEIVLENVRRIGVDLKRVDAAEELIADFSSRLEALKNLEKSSLVIAYVTPSGFTSGVGTFVDGIINAAGFRSFAALKGYKGWLTLPLEDLILDPPDMFVTSFFDTSMINQSNWSLSRHDRLLSMMEKTPTVHLPGSYLACNGLFLVDAAEMIRRKATEYGLIKNIKEPAKGNTHE